MAKGGLKDKTRNSLIKKRHVRPQVFNVSSSLNDVVSDVKEEEKVLPLFESESPKTVKSKKASIKKSYMRYEARLTDEHEKVVQNLHSKAFRESHPNNKGINNSELLGGLVEFISSFSKGVGFKNLDFKRGKLYGEATANIKKEVATSFEVACYQNLFKVLLSGNIDPNISKVLNSLSEQDKIALVAVIKSQTG